LQVFSGLAINTIGRCAFGVDTDAHHHPDQPLVKNGTELFASFRSESWFSSFLGHLFQYFPGIERLISLFPPSFDNVAKIAKDIMDER